MKTYGEQRESYKTFQEKVMNNYPQLETPLFNIFMRAHISDYRNLESAVRNMGDTLNRMGLLPLWDEFKFNANYISKMSDIAEQDGTSEYTDYRTQKTTESGSYVRMTITTTINNKTSESIDLAFRHKSDFRMLAYTATKLFLAVLENLSYSENRIAFMQAKITTEMLADLIKCMK